MAILREPGEAVGPPGPQGNPGADGAQGATGPTGPPGSAGSVGATGATGAAGAAGAAGAVGATGAAGAVGATGVGTTGATGPQGVAGTAGTAGATGAAGGVGATGATGAAGSAGAVGATGVQGATGATGDAGAAGGDGATGATGPPGSGDISEAVILDPPTSARNVIAPTDPDVIGLTVHTSGEPGLNAAGTAVLLTNDGDAVEQGLSCWEIHDDEGNTVGFIEADGNVFFRVSGSARATGAGPGFELRSPTNLTLMSIRNGAAQFKTDNGEEFSILTASGTVTSFEVYDDGHIVMSAQPGQTLPILDLRDENDVSKFALFQDGTAFGFPVGVGATGATGATGSAGSVGATGVTGGVGATGVTGATGATGGVGATGAQGATGAVGATGVTGDAGAPGGVGATGVQGATGATGGVGATGVQGATGATGGVGATGVTGATGATGGVGATGVQGATGATGGAGATGPQGVGYSDGWLSDSHTWTRTGNLTFTTNYDASVVLGPGTKIRVTDSGAVIRYGIVATSVHSAGTTTVTLITNDDHPMAAGAMTAPSYSYIEQPQAFPSGFIWTPTLVGWSSNPGNMVHRWFTVARKITLIISHTSNGTSNATNHTATLPVTALTLANASWGNPCRTVDNGVTQVGQVDVVSAGTVATLRGILAGTNTATGNSRIVNAMMTYEF